MFAAECLLREGTGLLQQVCFRRFSVGGTLFETVGSSFTAAISHSQFAEVTSRFSAAGLLKQAACLFQEAAGWLRHVCCKRFSAIDLH